MRAAVRITRRACGCCCSLNFGIRKSLTNRSERTRTLYRQILCGRGGSTVMNSPAEYHASAFGNGESARFGFGANWAKFNASLTDEQRGTARASLSARLGDIEGLSFLDIGAGSGLFSQAAADLGARVTAFDFDPASANIARGDVLDHDFMASLGVYDIVYAWGVLHHTGDMWEALANACDRVADGGRIFLAIYNDQGRRSGKWLRIKQA